MVICLLLCLASVTFGQASTTQIEAIAWSPDGQFIAYSSSHGSPLCGETDTFVYVINAVTGALVKTLTAGKCATHYLNWRADGLRLAGSSYDTFGYRVWDVESGQVIAVDNLGRQGVGTIRWHPLRNELAATSSGGGLFLSDAATGVQIQHNFHTTASDFDWNPDGSYVVISNIYEGQIYIVNTTTGTVELTMAGHVTHGSSVDWSPDGELIASASFDSTVKYRSC